MVCQYAARLISVAGTYDAHSCVPATHPCPGHCCSSADEDCSLSSILIMTDVYTLLTFPNTSRAFSVLPSQAQPQMLVNSRDSSRSASPPRKIPRLDGLSDSPFASVPSFRASIAEHASRRGPTTLRVVGLSGEYPQLASPIVKILKETI